MNEITANLSIFAFAIASGVRHGIDLDHIAAITDIVGSQKGSPLALVYSILYALGHGLVVIVLGVIILLIGQRLPEGIDLIFGKFVGISLIILGLYVSFSITKHGKKFKLKSRWMLVLEIIHPKVKEEKYAAPGAFGIGMIHGVGAETPTQIGAFLVLLGIGGGAKAVLFLMFFVLGIFVSNLAVAVLSLYGYKKFAQNQNIYLGIGFITAIFSIALGIFFMVS